MFFITCRGKVRLILFIIAGLFLLPLGAQSNPAFVIEVTPDVSIPLGASSGIFSLGAGARTNFILSPESTGAFSFTGGIGYNYLDIPGGSNLNLIDGKAGAIYGIPILPFLKLEINVSGGYFFGVMNNFDNTTSTGNGFLLSGGTALRFDLTPSFSLGLAANYSHYFGLFDGLEVSMTSRFSLGKRQTKPLIEILDKEIKPIFPIFYKYYDAHSLGSIDIKNSEPGSISNLQVQFFVPQYMDKPKLSTTVESMKKNEIISVPLYALFKDNVLSLTEQTAVSGEIIVAYDYKGESKSIVIPETVILNDRNSMTWDDDRKAASFVSAKDPAILRFARNISSISRNSSNPALNEQFRLAMAIFESMRLHGINYIIDPSSPYGELSENALAVDYLQFPRQTLEYKAGDCDDLSILYSALLQSIGIDTAFITVPGHIYVAFNLGMSEREARRTFSRTENIIFIEDESWIPVEVTTLDKGYMESWEIGARQWRTYYPEDKARIYKISEAWEVYNPIGFNEDISNILIPDEKLVIEAVDNVFGTFIADELKVLETRILARGNRSSSIVSNKLGALYARFGLYEKAKREFEKFSKGDSPSFASLINLGNIYFIEESYGKALLLYTQAYSIKPKNPSVLISLAKANYELENFGASNDMYNKAIVGNSILENKYAYLGSSSGDVARASSVIERRNISWFDEEE